MNQTLADRRFMAAEDEQEQAVGQPHPADFVQLVERLLARRATLGARGDVGLSC